MIDRIEVSVALAKALAFKQCGKHEEASKWARKLVTALQCMDILREESVTIEDVRTWHAQGLLTDRELTGWLAKFEVHSND